MFYFAAFCVTNNNRPSIGGSWMHCVPHIQICGWGQSPTPSSSPVHNGDCSRRKQSRRFRRL